MINAVLTEILRVAVKSKNHVYGSGSGRRGLRLVRVVVNWLGVSRIFSITDILKLFEVM